MIQKEAFEVKVRFLEAASWMCCVIETSKCLILAITLAVKLRFLSPWDSYSYFHLPVSFLYPGKQKGDGGFSTLN